MIQIFLVDVMCHISCFRRRARDARCNTMSHITAAGSTTTDKQMPDKQNKQIIQQTSLLLSSMSLCETSQQSQRQATAGSTMLLCGSMTAGMKLPIHDMNTKLNAWHQSEGSTCLALLV